MRLSRKCTRDHVHVRIEGKWTKDSAIYPGALAEELAKAYADGRLRSLEAHTPNSEGLDSPLVDDLAFSLPWSVEKAWNWKRPVRINLLETSCVYRLVTSLAMGPTPLRFCRFCESNVARSAVATAVSLALGL